MSSNSSNHLTPSLTPYLQAATSSKGGDIEHLTQLSENFGALCLSHEYSDVTLIVEGQQLHAHKVDSLAVLFAWNPGISSFFFRSSWQHAVNTFELFFMEA